MPGARPVLEAIDGAIADGVESLLDELERVMDSDEHLLNVRRSLLTFANQLAETPGRDEVARDVAQLLVAWDARIAPTEVNPGPPLSLAALRERVVGVRGAEDVLKVIDEAIEAGVA